MAGPDGVSKSVTELVKNVANSGGDKKKIDTAAEYDKLSEYLSAQGSKMSQGEKFYVEGIMMECKNNISDAEIKNETTPAARKLVSKVAAMFKDKKSINNEVEAQSLVSLLKNTKGDLNAADIEYIKDVLRKSGYGDMLTEQKESSQAAANETIEDNKKTPQADDCKALAEIAKKLGIDSEGKDPCKLAEEIRDKMKEATEPKTKHSSNSGGGRKVPTPKKGGNESKTEDKKYEVAEADSSAGIAQAGVIIGELNSTITNNVDIKGALAKVNDKNAFSFFTAFQAGTGAGINKKILRDVSDTFNNLTYEDTEKPMEKLLKQAQDSGLKETPGTKRMQSEINFINRLGTDKDPDTKQAATSDNAVNGLLEEMKKVIK